MKIFIFIFLLCEISSFKLQADQKRQLLKILRKKNNLMNIKTDFFLYLQTIIYIINTLPKNNLFFMRKFYSPMQSKLNYLHRNPSIFGTEIKQLFGIIFNFNDHTGQKEPRKIQEALNNKKRTRRIFRRNLNLQNVNLKFALTFSVYKKFVLSFVKTLKNFNFKEKTKLAAEMLNKKSYEIFQAMVNKTTKNNQIKIKNQSFQQNHSIFSLFLFN